MTPRRTTSTRRRLTRCASAAVLLAAFLLPAMAPSAAWAQQIDALLRDFELTGDYVLNIDGQDKPQAEVYMAEQVPALLVLANDLASPTLLLPREQAVQTVSFMKVVKRDDGTADILADAELTPAGAFRMQGETVVFSVDGLQATLKPKPPLLGQQDVASMLDYSPAYRRTADAYEPDAGAVRTLRGAEDVRVRVYFGSWCGFCKRYVPRMLKIAEELEGAPLRFEFYGLPHGFGDEPMAKRDDIHGVPTGIVYRDGKEIGRLEAADWQRPEAVLQRLVTGS